MKDAAQAEDLRDWICRHLDPLEEDEPVDGIHIDPELREMFEGPPSPAAVLIGLVERPHGYSVLLTRRADTLRRHTGQVAFPGGRRDPGETPWETALREAEEEIGLDRRFVTLAGLGTPTVTGSGYLITPVVGFVREGYRLTANPDEVADIFETPFGFLMDPANHEEREYQMENGQTRRYYAMTHEDRLIWGVTAGILRALYDRLYGAALA
ncbi:MAG: MutT/nudix family protein [Phenylobacterium sp.]|nr:MutT/nudix family protein [Phenylobacterium sp.]